MESYKRVVRDLREVDDSPTCSAAADMIDKLVDEQAARLGHIAVLEQILRDIMEAVAADDATDVIASLNYAKSVIAPA